MIESSGKTYLCDIEEDVHASGEKRAVQQLVTILLDNASKYCDDNGTIRIRLKKLKGKGAQCVISNTYADGASVDISRFFERFYRQDESHNSGKSGFGIGLSMAKEITERLRGKIKASYSDNTISFTVELQ